MLAHFRRIQRLIQHASCVTLFTEQEAGIRAAIFSQFFDHIQNRQVWYLYLNINKNVTRDERERASANGKKVIRKALYYLGLDYEDALHQLILNAMAQGRSTSRWQDI